MKISKLFHWLYASVMFLPLLVIPIFAVNIINRSPEALSIEQYEGRTVTFNQLSYYESEYDFPVEMPFKGITLEVTSNHKLHISGTSTESINLGFANRYRYLEGHKYIVVNNFGSSSASLYTHGQPSLSSTNTAFITSNGDIYPYNIFGIHINAGVTIDFSVEPYITDLTAMFGAGNEPTVEQFLHWFPNEYYSYTEGTEVYIPDYNVISYNDTDIGSQFVYSLYHSVDKYFNFDNVFNFGDLYSWLNSTFFSGHAPLGFFIFWHYLIYWLLISLLWLLFDVLMYVPNLVHRWLDKAAIE